MKIKSLLSNFSYHDFTNESSYHVFVFTFFLLITLGSLEYEAISNQESGNGRFDVALLHSSDGISYMFEFKKAAEKEDLVKLASDALKQIAVNNYSERIENKKKAKEYYRIGMAFKGKTIESKIKKCTRNLNGTYTIIDQIIDI